MKQNQITEAYFSIKPLTAERMEKIIPDIKKYSLSGLVIGDEIWKGTIYGESRVGSIAYDAMFRNKPAICKVYAIPQKINERCILGDFNAQNQSTITRVPTVFDAREWDPEGEYGYIITEKIEGKKIFTPPYATEEEMMEFCTFFDDYKKNCIVKPWMPHPKMWTPLYMAGRVWKWTRISKDKGMLEKEDYRPYVRKFYKFLLKNLPATLKIPMVLGHGHLGPNEIIKTEEGKYVLMSNMMWGYRPEWYEIGFLIWTCLLAVRNFPCDGYEDIITPWMRHLQNMDVAKKDPFFFQKVGILLIERFVGAILVDVGAHDDFKNKDKKYFRDSISMFQRLFNLYSVQLQPWLR